MGIRLGQASLQDGIGSYAAEKRAANATDTVATSKKFRSAIDESAAEFVCPITQELPVDPVMAEDGHVYERADLKTWLVSHDKSPVTNLPMGKRLLPAVQVKSAIEKLVRSGAIAGDKAERWQERLDMEDRVKELKRKAEAGDLPAMNTLGLAYVNGNGVPRDDVKAMEWYERAAQGGSVRGLTNLANSLCDEGFAMRLAYLTEAATRGDAWACVQLGEYYAKGMNGSPEDKVLAKRWYTKALSCTTPAPDEDDRKAASDWLEANAGVECKWKC